MGLSNRKTLIINLAVAVSFLLLSYLFIYPFITKGILFNGDDTWYQINRILEIKEGIKDGNFLPYVYTHSFGKIAYPLGIFYPEITIVPIAVLVLLLPHPVTGIYLGIAGYTLLSLVIVYSLLRKLGKTRSAAYIGSVLYAFSAYRTVDAFTRFALGEYIAMTFLPLCLYGFYMIVKGDRKKWVYLAIGFSGMLLSHVLTSFITALFLVICWIISLFWDKNKLLTILALLKAVVASILASLIFLEPFLEQELFQKYGKPTPRPLSDTAQKFSDMVISALDNSTLQGWKEVFSIGFFLILVVFLGIILYEKMTTLGKRAYTIGCISFIVASNLFPWNLLENTFISVIQYPFRILMLPTLLLAIVGADLVDTSFTKLATTNMKKISVVIVIVLGVLMMWDASVEKLFKVTEYTSQGLYTNSSRFFGGTLYTDQYTPKKTLKYLEDIYEHTAIFDNHVKVKLTSKSVDGKQVFISKKFKAGKRVDLPVSYYKNYAVYQGNEKLITNISKRNTIAVVLKNKKPISVGYEYTLLNKICYCISIFSWLVLAYLILYKSFFTNFHKRD